MSYSSPSCYVARSTPTEAAKLQQKLATNGYTIDQPPFTRFRATKAGISCMVYLSGKVLIQGKELEPFIAAFLPEQSSIPPVALSVALSVAPPTRFAKISTSPLNNVYKPCMGFDESGKGDVFGPLCLAGVYVTTEDAAQLREWGVCDSKTLTEKQILSLADKIRLHYPYESLVLMPERYNTLYEKFRNLNRLLAWGHVELMAALYQKTQATYAVLDQFCTPYEVESMLKRKQPEITLVQRTRAESSEIAVAAASIVARATFVEGMDTLSKQFGFKLPKGAAHGIVQAGKQILRQYGEKGLSQTVKLHFKTLLAIRG